MKLVYANTDREVQVGDTVPTFRGNFCKVQGYVKPHSSNSTGLVYVVEQDNRVMGYYPSVINAVWKD
jgi:hypothetical protein